jgi:8-oxo-dGTP diphosphatase
MAKNYCLARVGVDPVIFTIHEHQLKLLLHKREKQPFEGMLELPGGLVGESEKADDTLLRKLKEMTTYSDIFFEQFYTFSRPDRDPRSRTISIGFIALINSDRIKDFTDWHNNEKIKDLAFDHKEIIEKGKNFLKENINSLIVKQFLPKEFPLNLLQEAYELIEDKKYDNRNFRKKIISSGIVAETEKAESEVSHRPAKLYKFVKTN